MPRGGRGAACITQLAALALHLKDKVQGAGAGWTNKQKLETWDDHDWYPQASDDEDRALSWLGCFGAG